MKKKKRKKPDGKQEELSMNGLLAIARSRPAAPNVGGHWEQTIVDYLSNVSYLRSNVNMPTIFILDSIKIMIFFDDHNPPHFHAVYNEHEELIIIPTLDSIKGRLPRNQRKKLVEWARGHMEFIIKKWNEFNPDSKI